MGGTQLGPGPGFKALRGKAPIKKLTAREKL
jgi:hypothetical protein